MAGILTDGSLLGTIFPRHSHHSHLKSHVADHDHDHDHSLADASANSCGNPAGNEQKYNLPFHIGALFIILAVSSLACAFPILATVFRKLHIPPTFLFLARHFGTGVLLATAFVHLLPTAFLSLNDPCLGKFFTETYTALPGAIALAAVFFVALVEMVFMRGQHCCSSVAVDGRQRADAEQGQNYGVVGPHSANSVSRAHGLQQLAEQNGEIPSAAKESAVAAKSMSESDSDASSVSATHARKKALLQCMLLEMGILFHSVFIGIAISVAVGREFVVLLIAISFHQGFEGLALGARIAALKWEKRQVQPWLMALAYGCTTPLGQAIGLILHSSYDPASRTGLLVVGIMNAISSGLLIYASLVELMAEDFLSDESWKTLKGMRRFWACVMVFLGAAAMSAVGAWA